MIFLLLMFAFLSYELISIYLGGVFFFVIGGDKIGGLNVVVVSFF